MNDSQIHFNITTEYTLTERIFIAIFLSTICVTGVLGNIFPLQQILFSLFFFLILKTKGNLFVLYVAIRKQNYKYVTNCYIINLAITDFLFLSISVPLTIYLGLTDSWMLSNLIDCKAQLLIAHVKSSNQLFVND